MIFFIINVFQQFGQTNIFSLLCLSSLSLHLWEGHQLLLPTNGSEQGHRLHSTPFLDSLQIKTMPVRMPSATVTATLLSASSGNCPTRRSKTLAPMASVRLVASFTAYTSAA